jgi:hypothetical protein
MFDITILGQYFRYWGQEPIDIDREAIKRYLTTDESWPQRLGTSFRTFLQNPFLFTISLHEGRYRRQPVLEGIEVSDPTEESTLSGKPSNKEEAEEESAALLGRIASARSYYGTSS